MAVIGVLGIVLIKVHAAQVKWNKAEAVAIAVPCREHVKVIANMVAGHVSTKALAALAKPNALMTDTKPALQAASGRIVEQTQTMMPKTYSAATHCATALQTFMTQQKHQQKMLAQTP